MKEKIKEGGNNISNRKAVETAVNCNQDKDKIPSTILNALNNILKRL